MKAKAQFPGGPPLNEQALPDGTMLLGDQFEITGQLGSGGFGITYHAEDRMLGRNVVIKECFPADYCVRRGTDVLARLETHVHPVRAAIMMFMREARSLAKLRHPNIIGVHRVFEENETAYMALDLISGRDLFSMIEDPRTPLSPARVKDILLQLLDAIETVHEAGLLHRDISPDNVLLEPTGTPILIDFGAARMDASRQSRIVSTFMVTKEGYSPQEFYVADSVQTLSSDLYALGATFYHAISGSPPVSSQKRMLEIAGRRPDPCEPLAGRFPKYDDAFLEAIDHAMQVHPDDRLQSAGQWRGLLLAADAEQGHQPDAQDMLRGGDISLDLEMSLTRLVEETNTAVRKTSEATQVPEKAVAAPVEDAQKPAWVEEFNQESMVVPAVDRKYRADITPLEDVAPTSPVAALDAPAPQAAKTRSVALKSGETNWIDRAREKGERITSEANVLIEGIEADPDRVLKAISMPTPKAAQHGEYISDEVHKRVRRSRSVRIFAGFLMCVGFLFVMETG